MNWVQFGKMEEMYKASIADKMTDAAAELAQNKQMYDWAAEEIRVKTTNLPEGMRTPTAEEIEGMEQYSKEYRKKNPRASNREVRRATQRKFNVQMLPNTNR